MRFSQHFILVCALLVLSVSPALAETKIAVVNVQKLMADSIAAKDIQKQLKVQQEKFQNEFSTVEKELRDKQKKLTEDGRAASKEEFAKKRAAFEEQFISARGDVQKSRRALDEAVARAMNELRGHIITSAAKISEAQGYQLVLPRANVVLVSKDIDITEAVLADLNASVKAIKVELKAK